MPTKALQPTQHYFASLTANPTLVVILIALLLAPLPSAMTNPALQSVPIVTLDALGLALAILLPVRSRIKFQFERFRIFLATGVNTAALAYFGLAVASVFFAQPEVRFIGWFNLAPLATGLLLYFAITYQIRRTESLLQLNDLLLFLTPMLALYGLLRLGATTSDAAQLLFGKQQFFSAFLVVLLPITVVHSIYHFNSMRQIPAQASAGLTLICLSLTGTRLTWFAAGAELVVLAALMRYTPISRSKSDRSIQRFVFPTLMAICCMVIFVTAGGLDHRLHERINTDMSLKTRRYRREMAGAAATLIKTRPVFGTGPGSFPVYQHRFTGFGRPGTEVLHTKPLIVENAHNFWLQTTAEQGILAATMLGAVLVTFLIQSLRRLKQMDFGPRKAILVGCVASILGFIIDAFRNPAWQTPTGIMFLWLILGIGVACQRPRPRRSEG